MYCKSCNQHLLGEAFYASNKSRCKECVKKSVKVYRQANIESVRAYDRLRDGMSHRVAARKEYQATPSFALSHKTAVSKWVKTNPERKRATSLVSTAILRGKMMRAPCVVCGDEKVEGHHPDYSRPLDVVWLCNEHHREVHAMEAF